MRQGKGMGGILTGSWQGDGSRGIIATTGPSLNPGEHTNAARQRCTALRTDPRSFVIEASRMSPSFSVCLCGLM